MKPKHSDIGYPEEQPEDVHDETTKPDGPHKRGEGEKGDRPDDDVETQNSRP